MILKTINIQILYRVNKSDDRWRLKRTTLDLRQRRQCRRHRRNRWRNRWRNTLTQKSKRPTTVQNAGLPQEVKTSFIDEMMWTESAHVWVQQYFSNLLYYVRQWEDFKPTILDYKTSKDVHIVSWILNLMKNRLPWDILII